MLESRQGETLLRISAQPFMVVMVKGITYLRTSGDITKFIEPESEADPLAIYLQLIVAFGNYIGRTAFFEIEATKHYTNLFANIVGDSSISRKGTAGDYAKLPFIKMNAFL